MLHWLKGNPKKFKTLVCNRIAEIIDAVPKERWKHVASGDNPSDCHQLHCLNTNCGGKDRNGSIWRVLNGQNQQFTLNPYPKMRKWA